MQDIACEELRLDIQFGNVPSRRARTGMLDTVYRDIGVTDGLDYLVKHAPADGVIETGNNCAPLPSPAPKTIGQTRLDVEFPKPRPQ